MVERLLILVFILTISFKTNLKLLKSKF